MLKVIGLGSPFGDDQVGWIVIDALCKDARLQSRLGAELKLIALDRPGPALLNQFTGVNNVMLVDAVVSGTAEVGQLHCWSETDELESHNTDVSSHGLGLAQTLALGRQLDMLPDRLVVFGIEIDPEAADEGGLSARIGCALPGVVTRLTAEIKARLLGEPLP